MSAQQNTLFLIALLTASALAYERLQGPAELLFCDKEKSFGGYTLFGVGNKVRSGMSPPV